MDRKVAEFLKKELSEEQVTVLSHHLDFNSMKNNPAVNKASCQFLSAVVSFKVGSGQGLAAPVGSGQLLSAPVSFFQLRSASFSSSQLLSASRWLLSPVASSCQHPHLSTTLVFFLQLL